MASDDDRKSLAGRLFENQLHGLVLEDSLDVELGAFRYDGFTYDHYDSSVEIYSFRGENRDELLEKLGELGFWQAWIHDHRREVGVPCDCQCATLSAMPERVRA